MIDRMAVFGETLDYDVWYHGDVLPTDPPAETYIPRVWLPAPHPIDYYSCRPDDATTHWRHLWYDYDEQPPPEGYSCLTSLG